MNDYDKRCKVLGKHMSTDSSFYAVKQKEKRDEVAKRDKPSYIDRQNEKQQRIIGFEISSKDEDLTIEEIREKGFYVLQQYLIEKRRQEAGRMLFQSGQLLNSIMEDNLSLSLIKGYNDAKNEFEVVSAKNNRSSR